VLVELEELPWGLPVVFMHPEAHYIVASGNTSPTFSGRHVLLNPLFLCRRLFTLRRASKFAFPIGPACATRFRELASYVPAQHGSSAVDA
jgi:hypothetical protein